MQRSSNESRIDPKILLNKQFFNNRFIRWDTIIRSITVKHFVQTGKMHYLYDKDCYHRHKSVRGSLDGFYEVQELQNYKKLIKKFLKYDGEYKDSHPLIIDKNFLLEDGTHRLGIALALDYPYVIIEKENITKKVIGPFYFEYYKERFTDEEIKLMVNEYNLWIELM
jgi:hypothetical protein